MSKEKRKYEGNSIINRTSSALSEEELDEVVGGADIPVPSEFKHILPGIAEVYCPYHQKIEPCFDCGDVNWNVTHTVQWLHPIECYRCMSTMRFFYGYWYDTTWFDDDGHKLCGR